MAGADPGCVSTRAKQRQRGEMGTLGSGNHYLEVQKSPKSSTRVLLRASVWFKAKSW
jgi:RNA-splicing ligase RtcB